MKGYLMTRILLFYIFILLWFIRIPGVVGINFEDFTDKAGVPGTGVGNGIAVGDYDNDGDPDFYVSGDPRDILYRNKGDGTFQDVTIASGIFVIGDGVGAVFGDYDNDGDLDLYIPVNDGFDILFQNLGNGSFRDITKEARISNPNRARSASFADFNNDGFLDIYVVNEDASNILYKNRNGRFFENVAQNMNVAHLGPGRCNVWGDYDNDGDLDLYVTNKGASNVLFRNDGFGFKNVTKEAGVEGTGDNTGVAFADYNNDGYLDIYVCRKGGNSLYRNNADGSFTDMGMVAGVNDQGEGGTPAFGDYDNDGDLDLYLAVWKGNSILYSNRGDGTFEDVTQQSGLGAFGNSWGAVFADYDNDGDLDLYTTYTTRNNILYRNGGNNNNWLHIKTIGSSSNRDGIGARIKLFTKNFVQIREVSGGSGYASQESLPVEFGLSDSTIADLVEIRWPSGVSTRMTKIRANQMIIVIENFLSVEGSYIEDKIPNKKITDSRLFPNYPNPFNPETWLPYQLSERSDVNIIIFNSNGCLVCKLSLGPKEPGIYIKKNKAAYWNGKNDHGEKVAPGIYFYEFHAGSFSQTGKMVMQ